MSYYREQLESYLKEIDVKAERVLDIGGAAKPVKDRVKSWDVKHYEILDNGIEDGDYDIEFDLNVAIETQWKQTIMQRHNIVFCLEVFEYVWNPIMAIQNIYDFLQSEGEAYITLPFIYPVHNPQEHDFLRYTQSGIQKLMQHVGFKGMVLIPRKQGGNLDIREWYKSEGMHPSKGADHTIIGHIVHAKK